MRFDSEELAGHLLVEVVQLDTYRLQQFPMGELSTIVDLGANYGLFSLFARMLQPKAQIVAVEPHRAVFSDMHYNMRNLCVHCVCAGIGDGSRGNMELPARLHPVNRNSGSYELVSAPDGAVQTKRLQEIMDHVKIKIDDKTFVKMDIEGAEKHILLHKESLDYLHQAKAISAEIHLCERGMFKTHDELDEWLEKYRESSDRDVELCQTNASDTIRTLYSFKR